MGDGDTVYRDRARAGVRSQLPGQVCSSKPQQGKHFTHGVIAANFGVVVIAIITADGAKRTCLHSYMDGLGVA